MDPQIQKLIQLIPELRGGEPVVSPLRGGLTNRNYRIDTGGESYVLRVAGKDTGLLGIDRVCEVACARAAAELGVGPEVVAHLPEQEVLVRRFVAGRVLAVEDVQQPSVLRRVTEALRRYHDGPSGEGNFSPFEVVREYYSLARERNVSFPESLGTALERLAQIELDLQNDEARCPCHNDLLAGNFIDDGTRVQIIDWEYGGMGDRFFDLGNLAVNNEFGDQPERALLKFYFGGVRPEHLHRIRLMRLVSDMREAMWGYLQAGISTLGVDYSAYGRKHLERFLNSPDATGLS